MNDLIFYRIIIIIMARFEVVGTAENERSLQVVVSFLSKLFAQFKKNYTHTRRATRSAIKRPNSKRTKDEHAQTEKNGVDDD